MAISALPRVCLFVWRSSFLISRASSRDKDKTAKIITALNLSVPPRELRTDPRSILQAIARRWLPLAPALLRTAVEQLPSARHAQATRIPSLCRPLSVARDSDITAQHRVVYVLHPLQPSFQATTPHSPAIALSLFRMDSLLQCRSGADDPVVVFVSKVISVPKADILSASRPQLVCEGGPRISMPKARPPAGTAAAAPAIPTEGVSIDVASELASSSGTSVSSSASASAAVAANDDGSDEEFVAFARVFSGVLKVGQTLHVLGPQFNPAHPTLHHTTFTIPALYLMMGRSLESIDECQYVLARSFSLSLSLSLSLGKTDA